MAYKCWMRENVMFESGAFIVAQGHGHYRRPVAAAVKARGGCLRPLTTIVAFSRLGTPPPLQPTLLASAQATSSERASPIPCPPSLSVSLQWSSHSLRKKKRTFGMFPAIWQNVKTRPFLRNSCRGQVFCQCGSKKHPIKRPNDHWPWNGRYPELPQDMGDLWSNWVRSDRAKKWGYHRCSIKNTEFLAENAFLFVSIYRIKFGRWWVLILIFRIIKKKNLEFVEYMLHDSPYQNQQNDLDL